MGQRLTALDLCMVLAKMAAHTALIKKAKIFNNFARVTNASIFERSQARGQRRGGGTGSNSEIDVSGDHGSRFGLVGVIQISRKAVDPKFAQDFSRQDLHDLEIVGG